MIFIIHENAISRSRLQRLSLDHIPSNINGASNKVSSVGLLYSRSSSGCLPSIWFTTMPVAVSRSLFAKEQPGTRKAASADGRRSPAQQRFE